MYNQSLEGEINSDRETLKALSRSLVKFFDWEMGAEESRTIINVPRNSSTTTNRQRSCRPSVSEFSNNPKEYPDFVLVLVVSTGKMEVMTRQEARARAAQIKIISDSSASANSSFFRSSSSERRTLLEHLQGNATATEVYFDVATGRFGVCKREEQHRYQREGLIWLN